VIFKQVNASPTTLSRRTADLERSSNKPPRTSNQNPPTCRTNLSGTRARAPTERDPESGTSSSNNRKKQGSSRILRSRRRGKRKSELTRQTAVFAPTRPV